MYLSIKVAIVFFFASLLSGCFNSGPANLVGSWTCKTKLNGKNTPLGLKGYSRSNIRFENGGRYTGVDTTVVSKDRVKMEMKFAYAGRWTRTEKSLNKRLTGVKVLSAKVAGVQLPVKAIEKRFNRNKNNKNISFNIDSLGYSRLTISNKITKIKCIRS